jgi:hypothetical protein
MAYFCSMLIKIRSAAFWVSEPGFTHICRENEFVPVGASRLSNDVGDRIVVLLVAERFAV